METTVHVSLNSIAFNINENAYQQLKSYINELQVHFADDLEIIDDIEARIADLLSLRIKCAEQAVNVSDISDIIEIIGKPEDFDDETEKFKKHFENKNSTAKKRLYRDADNKIIAGICSGISHYLNLNVTWVRIVFLLFMTISIKMDGLHFWFSDRFLLGIPLILFVYIVLWIVVPNSKTPRQNLEMHGYSAIQNTSNIRANGFVNFLVKLFRFFIQVCVCVSLSIMGIVCSLLFIAGIAGFFGGSVFGGKNLIDMLDYIYIGEIEIWIAKLVIALLIFIPLGVFIYLSVKVLMRLKIKDKPVMFTLLMIWIASAIFAFGGIATTAAYYRHRSTESITENSNEINITKRLNIKIPEHFTPLKIAASDWDSKIYTTSSSNSLFIFPQVHIIHTDTVRDHRIKVVKSARASTEHEANQKAQVIPNSYIISDSTTMTLQPLEFSKYKKWSMESVNIYINLPDFTEVNFN